MRAPILRGQRVRIRPEWQDPGDDDIVWFALEDEDGGRVLIAAAVPDMTILPRQVVSTDMIEPWGSSNQSGDKCDGNSTGLP